MDVDDLVRVFAAQLRRQDLHVAGKYHHFGIVLLDQARNLGEGWLLVLWIDRDVVVRDTVPLHHAAQVIMVGNHAGDFAVQFIAVPAMQQVGQAVRLAAGHQHDTLLLFGIGDTPVHRELFGDRGKGFAQRFDTKWQGVGTDFVTHEEPATEIVRVMARFSDPAVV
ncbi:hypothetical protein D9M73_162170 [compost metagenome]